MSAADQPAVTLLVRTGGVLAALPLAAVIETLRLPALAAVHDAPAGVIGLAVVRGRPIPVVDLPSAGATPESGPSGRLVVLRAGAHRVGIRVDAVLGLRTFAAGELAALPPLLAGPETPLAGLALRDGGLVHVLEALRLVPPDVAAFGRSLAEAS